MTDEEKKAIEAENKDMKALSKEELEEVAGGAGIGGGAKGGAKGGAIYNATGAGIGDLDKAYAPEVIYQG